MTEPVPSGEQSAATDAPAPAFGSFGGTRGSGLARGKRSTTPAASSANSAPAGEYHPTALEVITPAREYTNPFGGETSVPAPAAETPAPAPSPAPAPAEMPAAPAEAPTAAADPALAAADPADPALAAADPAAPSKAELNILPPTETKRVATSWEHGGAEQREQRPVFRPERRESGERREGGERPEAREGGDRRDPREGGNFRGGRERRDFNRGEGQGGPRRFDRPREGFEGNPSSPEGQPEGSAGAREGSEGRREGSNSRREGGEGHRSRDFRGEQRPDSRRPSYPESRSEAPRPKGFIAWLKGLFGAKPVESSSRPSVPHDGDAGGQRGEQGGHRRRHRGGRGRHGGGYRGDNFRGEGQHRPEGSNPAGEAGGASPQGEHSGEHRGDDRGGQGGERRRHRGGRGRHGGDRGDRGGPRPEGQQGGGYI